MTGEKMNKSCKDASVFRVHSETFSLKSKNFNTVFLKCTHGPVGTKNNMLKNLFLHLRHA